MLKDLDSFYVKHEEPILSTLLALKEIILSQDNEIVPAWKYGMPFFYYKNKMLCYLWVHKKYKQPYIGVVEGKLFDEPFMIQEKRSRMKIMLIDPNADLPIKQIQMIIEKVLKNV